MNASRGGTKRAVLTILSVAVSLVVVAVGILVVGAVNFFNRPLPARTGFYVLDDAVICTWDAGRRAALIEVPLERFDERAWILDVKLADNDRAVQLGVSALPTGVGWGDGETPPGFSELQDLFDGQDLNGGASDRINLLVAVRPRQHAYDLAPFVIRWSTGEPAFNQTISVNVTVDQDSCSAR